MVRARAAGTGDGDGPRGGAGRDVRRDLRGRVAREVRRRHAAEVLQGAAVESAALAQSSPDQKTISVVLTPDGREAFPDESVGWQVAILWHGKVILTPAIFESKITGRTVNITGRFTDAEAKQMVDAMNRKGN